MWFALLLTFLIWFALMLPFVPRGSYAGRSAEWHIYNVLYIALIVVGLPFYWRVQSCDPGMTAQEMEPYMEQGSMAGIVRRDSAAPVNDIGVARVCEKCDLWMGPRTKHCHLCRKCIDGFDHHCIAAGSLVALASGISLPIEQVQAGDVVLSRGAPTADAKADEHLVPRVVQALLPMGSRACVELRFDDGRTLECTPDHRLLTSEGEWCEAGKLEVGSSYLAASVEFASSSRVLSEADRAWTLDLEELGTFDLVARRAATFAFARILGRLLSDAGLSGPARDLSSINDDLFELIGQRCDTDANGVTSVLTLRLPESLARAYRRVGVLLSDAGALEPVSSFFFPPFLLSPSCPMSIVREFLGGLFGGAGRTTFAADKQGDAASASVSLVLARTDGAALREQQAQITRELIPLLERFGVPSNAVTLTMRENQLQLMLGAAALLPFARNIGFRHAHHEQLKLTAAAARLRLHERMHEHHSGSVNETVEQWQLQRFVSESSNKQQDSAVLPTFRVRLIARREVGLRPVFDLAVPARLEGDDRFDSFSVGGLIAHNCLYLNTCVGKRNYTSFMLMLTLLNALLALQLYVTFSLLIRAGRGDANVLREISDSALGSREAFLALLIALSLVPLIFLGFVLALWSFHVYIILRGLTTYEWILAGRAAREKIRVAKEEEERKAKSAQLTASKQQVEQEWLANREAEKKKRASILTTNARNGSVSSRPPFPAVRGAAAIAAKPQQTVVAVPSGGGGEQASLTVQPSTHSHSSSRELGGATAGAATTPAHASASTVSAARPDTLSEVTLEMKEEGQAAIVPAAAADGAAAFNLSIDADPIGDADPSPSPPAASSASPLAVPPRASVVAMSPRTADECLVSESANPLLSAIAHAAGIGGGSGDAEQQHQLQQGAEERQRGESYMLPVPPYVLAQQEAAAAASAAQSRRATQAAAAAADKEPDSSV